MLTELVVGVGVGTGVGVETGVGLATGVGVGKGVEGVGAGDGLGRTLAVTPPHPAMASTVAAAMKVNTNF
jgi:hypothetical protein